MWGNEKIPLYELKIRDINETDVDIVWPDITLAVAGSKKLFLLTFDWVNSNH